jgi:hypothetical protein
MRLAEDTSEVIRRTITVEAAYVVGRQDPEKGVFVSGVPVPRYIREIRVGVYKDVDFAEDDSQPRHTGRYQLHVHGSRRAYRALGKYFLSLSELRTLDPDYHTHFDDVEAPRGSPTTDIIVHGPEPSLPPKRRRRRTKAQ